MFSAGFALIRKAAREPLVHFLAVGAALFVLNGFIQGPDASGTGEDIVISKGRVAQIAQSFVLLTGRPPTQEEIMALVDDFVSEETGYREAVAMGLDADDTIVRRRMRQKIEFLIEDSVATDAPSEADLQAWLEAHPERFRLPERRALQQVLISSDKRGASAAADAEAALKALQAGGDAASLGDRSMLPDAIPLTTQEGVMALYGESFANAVFSGAARDQWFGPVESPFGLHLVKLLDREAGRDAPLSEVAERVQADLIKSRRDEARDAFHAQIRKRYAIRVEWPEPWKGLPASPDPEPSTRPAPEVGE
jgi:hypothetical protein